jgi:hypothetical protein
MEKFDYGATGNKGWGRSAHSATVAHIEDGGGFSGEPMLFANDSGTGVRIRYKPKHRIRAHRTASKKRHAVGIAGQGSLFEIDFRSAKTA